MADEDEDQDQQSDFADELGDDQEPPDEGDNEAAFQMAAVLEADLHLPTGGAVQPKTIDISELERLEAEDDSAARIIANPDGSVSQDTFTRGQAETSPSTGSPQHPIAGGEPAGTDSALAERHPSGGNGTATATLSRPAIDVEAIVRETIASRLRDGQGDPTRDDAYRAYLSLLEPLEREKIVSAAYELGLDRKDPAWLNTWGAQRAAIQTNAMIAKLVAIVDESVAKLKEPQQYVVHADAGTVGDDIGRIQKQLAELQSQVEALPYRSVNDVHKMTEPFVELAKASAQLVRSLDSTRINAVRSIEEAAEAAREQMLRTAFEKHALPAETNKKYHVISIWLIALAIAVGIAVFLEPFILTRVGMR